MKNTKVQITGDDAREGITCVVSVIIPDPQFEGQTKERLGNSEVRGIVESAVGERLSEFLEENPATAKKIIAYRERRAFTRTSQLQNVRGIGQKTYRKLAPLVKVEAAN